MLERGPSEESGGGRHELLVHSSSFYSSSPVDTCTFTAVGKRKEGKPPPFAPLLINIRVYPPTFAANTVIDEFAARLFARRKTAERV